MKNIIFLSLALVPSLVLAHGTVADQIKYTTEKVLKEFTDTNKNETDKIVSFHVEKTAEEKFTAKVKTSTKEYIYKCGLDEITKGKWGCKLQ